VLEGQAKWKDQALDYKRVRGGFLVQERARPMSEIGGWTVVTQRIPTDQERVNLEFAWRAVGSVKSNAILIARDGATIGIGAGQMSRVDAAFLSVHKAKLAGHDTHGAVLGSDAFFPFRDGVEQAAEAGITAIIQPGGSVRDEEVIAAANEHGIAMVFTGQRQFRH
jgi:phosphoribosylaminoimidazolecarboxamide formyltransferase/IMP cyclohydrolase